MKNRFYQRNFNILVQKASNEFRQILQLITTQNRTVLLNKKKILGLWWRRDLLSQFFQILQFTVTLETERFCKRKIFPKNLRFSKNMKKKHFLNANLQFQHTTPQDIFFKFFRWLRHFKLNVFARKILLQKILGFWEKTTNLFFIAI